MLYVKYMMFEMNLIMKTNLINCVKYHNSLLADDDTSLSV